MIYSLIAYKANSSDYCMGCHMASYSSDFAAWSSTHPEEIAVHYADILDRNRKLEHGEDAYEITMLIDGIPNPYSDFVEGDSGDVISERREALSEEFALVAALAQAHLARIAEQRRAEADAAARKAQLAKEDAERQTLAAQEAAERAEYERLAAKFNSK